MNILQQICIEGDIIIYRTCIMEFLTSERCCTGFQLVIWKTCYFCGLYHMGWKKKCFSQKQKIKTQTQYNRFLVNSQHTIAVPRDMLLHNNWPSWSICNIKSMYAIKCWLLITVLVWLKKNSLTRECSKPLILVTLIQSWIQREHNPWNTVYVLETKG